MIEQLNSYRPHVLSILRVITGLMFLQHGTQKILNFPEAPGWEIAVLSLPWIAGILELFGSIFIVLGLFTRPVSFLLSGLMACAYFMAHYPQGFYPITNGGELAILFCFIFLYLVFAGSGRWSLDAYMKR